MLGTWLELDPSHPYSCNELKQTYKPYTLVGPAVTRPVQDPLAVLCLKNRLKIKDYIFLYH